MERLVVLDTETTGLSPQAGHRMIELGCVEIINRRVTGNNFHEYYNPEREIEQGAQQVHGITNEFVSSKPLFKQHAEKFLDFVRGAELVIHNAPFDVGFLNHELQLANSSFGEITEYCTVTDTLQMARKLYPGQRNNLDALCQRLNVNNSNRQLHGALIDADLTAQVYLAMTGGQVSLFGKIEAAAVSHMSGDFMYQQIERGGAIPVLLASADELAAHEVFMGELE